MSFVFKSGWVCLSPVGPEVHSPPCTPLSVTAQAEGSGRQAMPLVRCSEFCSCSGCSFKGDSKFENLLFCQKGLFELSENQLEEGDNYKSHCLARRAVLSCSRSVFPGQSSTLQTSSKGKKRSTANSHCNSVQILHQLLLSSSGLWNHCFRRGQSFGGYQRLVRLI